MVLKIVQKESCKYYISEGGERDGGTAPRPSEKDDDTKNDYVILEHRRISLCSIIQEEFSHKLFMTNFVVFF